MALFFIYFFMKKFFSRIKKTSIVSILIATLLVLPVFASGPDGFFNNIFADGDIQANKVVMGLQGVIGESNQQNDWGVMGNALETGSTGGIFNGDYAGIKANGTGMGGYFNGKNGGVYATSTSGNAVVGEVSSAFAAVRGSNNSDDVNGVGVDGYSKTGKGGVFTGAKYGVYSMTLSSNGVGGYFEGIFGPAKNNVKLGTLENAFEAQGNGVVNSGTLSVSNSTMSGEFKNLDNQYSVQLTTDQNALEASGRITANSNSDIKGAGYFSNSVNNTSVSLADSKSAITANGDLVVNSNKHGASAVMKVTSVGTTRIMSCPDGTFMAGLSFNTSTKDIIEVFCKNL